MNVEEIQANLTVDQMQSYIQTVIHLRYEDPKQFMDKEPMRLRAAAKVYAGENRMGHHGSAVTKGGYEGLSQLVSARGTVASAKFAAGDWLRIVRETRALGYRGAAVWGPLNTAAKARRAALERAGVAA